MSVLDELMQRWGIWPLRGDRPRESRSAAGVVHVDGRHGQAFLKVTTPAAGTASMGEARRELAFYRHVAPEVPQAAPRLLEYYEGPDGVALLVEDAGRVLPVEAWDPTRWTRLAEVVREIHSLSLPPREEFVVTRPLVESLSTGGGGALEFWAGLHAPLTDVLAVVSEAAPSLLKADAFVHGDLHLDNVITTSDCEGVRIADWQQCGPGSAMADLAFVNVRLAPSGRTAPDAFLGAYAAAGGDDLVALRRAATLLELATYLYLWPPFAAYNDDKGIANVRSRTEHLAAWALSERMP